MGRSVHFASEAAAAGTADYLLFGTVFESASKAAGTLTRGLAGLRDAVVASRVPVIAIGGINPERARECIDAGARGVAAIGLFLPPGRAPGARGIRPATEALRRAMRDEKA
jgi:thiamine monophosphate synthase